MPQVAARFADDLPPRRPLPWWGWLIAAALTYGVAVLTLLITTPDAPVAPWWPAAGVAMVLALLAPSRQLWIAVLLVLVVSVAANVSHGRPLAVSVLFALANATEIAVIAALLGLHRHRFTLDSMRAAARFIGAVLAGGIVLGGVVGVVALLSTGAEFVPTAVTVAASHIAAILLIGPFGALPAAATARSRMPAYEGAVQWLLVLAATVYAFRPGAELPLSFLVFSFLGWGLLRQRLVLAYAQSLTVAILVLLLTRFDPTSFGSQPLALPDVVLTTVVYLGTLGVFTVALVTARSALERAHALTLRSTQSELDAERERADVLRLKLELDRQREDFVATTSHELRTPITSIAGYTELLADSATLNDRERAWVDVIDRNTARLAELVEDLLALGRASSPLPARAIQTIALTELIGDVIATHRPAAHARGLAVADSSVAALGVVANPSDIRRALTNLVTNAIKFTPQGGAVEIRAERRDDVVAVTVTDTGPGMSADTVAHAFERFYRGADAEQLNTPGTGLGLSIVRELIERNHGTVWLERPETGGLRAGFALPAAPAP